MTTVINMPLMLIMSTSLPMVGSMAVLRGCADVDSSRGIVTGHRMGLSCTRNCMLLVLIR